MCSNPVVRVSTLVVVLAAVLALPAARLAGLIGGSAPTESRTIAAATVPGRRPAVRKVKQSASKTLPTVAPPTTAPAAPSAAPPVPTVRYTPSLDWTVADLPSSGVEVYASPTATEPSLEVSGDTEFGNTRVLPVIGEQFGWLEVRLPVRPNNAVGWIQAGAVTLSTVEDQIFVSLESHLLQWYHGQTLVLQTPVAIGAPSSPTPAGEYYITDVLASSGAYGPFILALNGHSDTYTDFDGGDARLAIHGTDAPSTIGEAVSNGCVHVPNGIDTVMAGAIKAGTLVEIS